MTHVDNHHIILRDVEFWYNEARHTHDGGYAGDLCTQMRIKKFKSAYMKLTFDLIVNRRRCEVEYADHMELEHHKGSLLLSCTVSQASPLH